MSSPVPKHLRSEIEHRLIPESLLEHVVDLDVQPTMVDLPLGPKHRAKFASGLVTELVGLAKSESLGDPMAGTGMLAWESSLSVALNELDFSMAPYLDPLVEMGCEVIYGPAHKVKWEREVLIFSPPYYPRTDRRKPNAHDDEKRGSVVGFRDSYDCEHPDFIGNPGGVHAIRNYRVAMSEIYEHLIFVGERMIVVTKNWWRLGVELRLDLDTILMAEDAGWRLAERHGWEPRHSLWSRYNQRRGGFKSVEDVLMFERS